MSFLRSLVLLASSLQMLAGSYIGYRYLHEGKTDLLALILCALLVLSGLTSLSGLLARPKPSVSRVSTVKLNMLFCGLILISAGTMALIEYQQGVTRDRLEFMAMAAAIVAAPFLINGMALGLIEQRMKKLA